MSFQDIQRNIASRVVIMYPTKTCNLYGYMRFPIENCMFSHYKFPKEDCISCGYKIQCRTLLLVWLCDSQQKIAARVEVISPIEHCLSFHFKFSNRRLHLVSLYDSELKFELANTTKALKEDCIAWMIVSCHVMH